MKTNINIHKAY